jgi:hypothetical protein
MGDLRRIIGQRERERIESVNDIYQVERLFRLE